MSGAQLKKKSGFSRQRLGSNSSSGTQDVPKAPDLVGHASMTLWDWLFLVAGIVLYTKAFLEAQGRRIPPRDAFGLKPGPSHFASLPLNLAEATY